MTEPIDILAHNTAAWNLQAAKDCDWSRPVDSAEIARARAGIWQARLTPGPLPAGDRKSTRLNSSHLVISYAVFCLKKKNRVWILIVSSSALSRRLVSKAIQCS